MKTAHRMFYTEDEMANFTLRDKILFYITDKWYNLTEWLLILIERDHE